MQCIAIAGVTERDDCGYDVIVHDASVYDGHDAYDGLEPDDAERDSVPLP